MEGGNFLSRKSEGERELVSLGNVRFAFVRLRQVRFGLSKIPGNAGRNI